MKKEALFCDGTEAYVSPPEPEAGDELQLCSVQQLTM